eukprot:scaffold205853_cov38-Prasinocladus_malaysianus.AAC.1
MLSRRLIVNRSIRGDSQMVFNHVTMKWTESMLPDAVPLDEPSNTVLTKASSRWKCFHPLQSREGAGEIDVLSRQVIGHDPKLLDVCKAQIHTLVV